MREARNLRRSGRQWLRERFPPRTLGWTRTWSTIQARLRMRRGITVSHRMPSRRRRGITVSHRMLSSTSQRPGSKPKMLRLRIVVRVRSHQTTSPDVRTDRRSARSGLSGDGAGLTRVARRRGDPAQGEASTRRFVRSGRRIRVSPGLRRPSRRATGRSRQSCRTFPPRSPPLLRLDFEPAKKHGDGLGAPFGKTEGDAGPSPCSLVRWIRSAPATLR